MEQISPDSLLNDAVGHVDSVIIVGWTDRGELYLSSSTPRTSEMLHMLHLAKDFIEDE